MTPRRIDRRTALKRGLATVTLVGIAGCLGGSPDAVTVEMSQGLAFDPEDVTVATGGTVTWVNESDVAHTVTASEASIPDGGGYFASGGFDSEQVARRRMDEGLLSAGEDYAHTFEQSGNSEVLRTIAQERGTNMRDIRAEINRRERVLRHLQATDVTDYREFTRTIREYYAAPDRILNQIESAA
jgi:plastocyanin